MEKNLIVTIIINIFIILISLYLFFLFVKSKQFHTIPCYNMIMFSLILCIDNIFRIIPFGDEVQTYNFMEYTQAFVLVWFDKLILATLSMQALIYYLGVTKTNFYYAHEKAIFAITFIISIIITLVLSIIYIKLFGLTKYGIYYYCDDPDKEPYKGVKAKIDTIFNSIYVTINIFCILGTLYYIWKKGKKATLGDQQDIDYKSQVLKTIFMFLINNWAFLLSFLIIYDLINYNYIDIIYLTTCLVIDLFISINKTVINETQVIFCRKKVETKNLECQLKTIHSYDEEDDYSRTESF